jgi:RNA recognition motif-containing protein
MNMSKELLFDTVWDEFSVVGPIKVTGRIVLSNEFLFLLFHFQFDKKANKPCVLLYNIKGFTSRLNGTAIVTFENEESVRKAIMKFNGKLK